MPKRIIILDTPEKNLQPLGDAFNKASNDQCAITYIHSPKRLTTKLRTGLPWDLLILDGTLSDTKNQGLKLLTKLRNNYPDLPIVVVAEQGNVDIVHQAIQAGATDFLVRSGKLVDRVATLLKKVKPHLNLIDRNRMLSEHNMLLQEAAVRRYQIVGESPQIMAVFNKIEKVAQIPRPVLITGERGTGKELVARGIHQAAGDGSRPMVVVNCAAFPDNLLETELFGHEKGAFTGADHQVHGKFELAGDGTLFLDEIGNMSQSFQQKILRVVEYGTLTRVGGSTEIAVKTRIIAATNVDLNQKIAQGEFLQDLYDRLSFEVIKVPALRNRQGDIEILARHFLTVFMQEIPSLRGKCLSQKALRILSGYSFPGNVRELKNIIERAAYRDTTSEITPEDLGMSLAETTVTEGHTFNDKIAGYKKKLLVEALNSAGGNQAQAARNLGLSYHQYRYFIRKYNLN